MPHRIALLALCLLLVAALAAAAEPPATAAAPAPAPTSLNGAAAAPTTAPDLGWLQRLDARQSLDPSLPALPGASLPPTVKLTTCIMQCVKNGGDPMCCAYMCHPIGEDPC